MDDFNDFTAQLRIQLKKPLPGNEAHIKMASKVRVEELSGKYDISAAKQSSVLILLYPYANSIYTVLMKRTSYNGIHSGQISFPGGKREKSDNSFIDTALREANEEVGILPETVEILGQLSDMYIPPSNFLVHPILGFSGKRPDLLPDSSEVEEIIETDIKAFYNGSNIKEKELEVRGQKIKTLYFDINGHIVWGATAMIISELKEVVQSMRFKSNNN